MSSVVIEEFRSVPKNSLRGFCRARFPSGMVVHEIAVHITDGRAWASPPARAILDRNGAPMRDAAGKTRWQPLITFAHKNIRDAWSAQVVAAVHEAFPDALLMAEGASA
jgi:hypothetical protein